MKAPWIALVAAVLAVGVHAQTTEGPTPQQQRMKDCNAQASKQKLKGDERKSYMSTCLKGEKKTTAQQDKMKSCNKQAGEGKLKGDERRKFMSDCLRAG